MPRKENKNRQEFVPRGKKWNPDEYEIHTALILYFDRVTIKDREGNTILKTEKGIY